MNRSSEPRWYEGASPWVVALFVFALGFAVVSIGLLMLSS